MENRLLSLGAAARDAGVPEERLRRAILTGDLVARPVDDDRQYLVLEFDVRRFLGRPVPAPQKPARCCGNPLVLLLFLTAIILLTVGASAERFTSFYECGRCDATRVERELEFLSVRFAVCSDTGPGRSPKVSRTCDHSWILLKTRALKRGCR